MLFYNLNLLSTMNKYNRKPGYITADLMNYHYLKLFREVLLKNETEAEKEIWKYLRSKQLGYTFRRQHIIDNFIVDFVCLSKKLVIEIDGGIHLTQIEEDELRTLKLNSKGFRVIRFTNEEVLNNIESVVERIKKELG